MAKAKGPGDKVFLCRNARFSSVQMSISLIYNKIQ